MRNRLSITERIYLNWCAWRDVKRNAFRQEHMDDGTGVEIDSFAASEFMETELANMEASRNAAHLKKRVLFWMPACGAWIRIWKCRCAATALNQIVRSAKEIHGDIQLLFAENNSYSKEIDDRMQDYTDPDALHFMRLHQNKSRQKARRIFVKLKRLYRMQIAQLSMALEILKKTENVALWYQTKYFLRIRYYYQCASSKDPRLPVQYLGDDRLLAIANGSLMYPYEQTMRELQKTIDELMLDLQQLSE